MGSGTARYGLVGWRSNYVVSNLPLQSRNFKFGGFGVGVPISIIQNFNYPIL